MSKILHAKTFFRISFFFVISIISLTQANTVSICLNPADGKTNGGLKFNMVSATIDGGNPKHILPYHCSLIDLRNIKNANTLPATCNGVKGHILGITDFERLYYSPWSTGHVREHLVVFIPASGILNKIILSAKYYPEAIKCIGKNSSTCLLSYHCNQQLNEY